MLLFRLKGRWIRLWFPGPDRQARAITHTETGKVRTKEDADNAYRKEVWSRWRELVLLTKAKLVAIQRGISDVETEFLSSVVLPNGTTFGEWAQPQIAAAYAQGEMPPLLPAGR